MNLKALEQLGLSNVESKVYLGLLDLGSATANKVAEKSGIHRRTVYDALETLIEKGIVSFVIEANKKYYSAESPERFLDILENKRQDFLSELPGLLLRKKLSGLKQEINVYRGKKGLKSIFEDMIKSRSTIHLFGSGGNFRKLFGEIYSKRWFSKAISKKIRIKAIYGLRNRDNIKLFPNQEARFVPDIYNLPSSTTIYKNKVVIIIYSEQPSGILIESKEVARSYLEYFEALWKSGKKKI